MQTPIAGDIHTALGHLTIAGLAAILDEACERPARFWWTDAQRSRAMLEAESDVETIGRIVQKHADRVAAAESWVRQRVAHGTRAGSGIFTARAKVLADDAAWAVYGAERRDALRRTELTQLDHAMIQGTGEPAWWRRENNQYRPDQGASRWEMKTRNRGEEFLINRLGPLAKMVAGRPIEKTLAGLLGHAVDDELGKNAQESRTATGLTTPWPVDSTVAWCALWGLSLVPTIPRLGVASRSPGMWPVGATHPRRAALPVFASPVCARRFSQILTSGAFEQTDPGEQPASSANAIDRAASLGWLKDQGVRAIVHFPVHKGGSPNAPERQLLRGDLEVLT